MTPELTREQLSEARARAGRQDGRPLLTAEDAAAWLRETGLCLFTPRPDAIGAPAPSFSEAVAGRAGASGATLEALAPARQLIGRLCRAGDAVALHLLPKGAGGESDQPDFLATEETFPFLFALRGDREWRRGPRGKSTPLALEVWKQLAGGAQTAAALQRTLGRHLTEAAVLRALGELWAELRLEPVYADGGDTHWQLLEVRHERAMTVGAAMGQGTALSALVSVYLQAAVAATGDELERFLSPAASRSRVRDAVRGLVATRQLGVRPLGADEYFYVEGSLPEFGELGGTTAMAVPALKREVLTEVAAPADLVIEGEGGARFRIEALPDGPEQDREAIGEGRKRYTAARGGGRGSDAPRPERKSFGGGGRPFPRGGKEGGSPGAGRTPFFAREPWKEDRPRPGAFGKPTRGGEERATPSPAENTGRPAFPKRPAAAGDRKPFAPSGERKPFGGERKPWGSGGKPFRAPKPFGADQGGSPFRKSSSDREHRPFAEKREEFRPRGEGAPAARHEGFGGPRKPFGERPDTDQRPFSDRPRPDRSGPDRSGPDRSSPDRPSPDRRPFGGARPKPPFPKRSFGGKEPFRPREDARPFGGDRDRKPFGDPADRPAFPPRGAGGSGEQRPPFRGDERRTPFKGGFKPPMGRTEGGSSSPKPFRGKTDGGFGSPKPFRPRREEDAGPSFRQGGGSGEGSAARFSPGAPRPPRPGAGSSGPGGKRPRTAPFTSSGKPRPGVGGATGRPGPRAGRPAGASGKPGSRPFGGGAGRKGPAKGPGKGKPPRRDA